MNCQVKIKSSALSSAANCSLTKDSDRAHKRFLPASNILKTMMPKTLEEEEDSDGISLSSESSDEISRSASSKSVTTDTAAANASDAQSEIAKKETKLVKCSKALVFFVLLAAAAGCGAGKLLLGWTEKKYLRPSSDIPLPFSLATHLFMANEEENDFRDQVSPKE
jgi:hypothetical protein